VIFTRIASLTRNSGTHQPGTAASADPLLREQRGRRTPTARYRKLKIAFGLLGLAALVYLNLTTGAHHLLSFHPQADKLEHVLAFGALMGWFGRLYRRGPERLLCAVWLLLLAVGLEFGQGAINGYFPVEYDDILADAAGILCGWLMLRIKRLPG
jgi:hypothetical protein